MKHQKKTESKSNKVIQHKSSIKVQENKPGRNKVLIWLFLIAIVTLISYSPALKNGITNWDDDQYIVENPWLQDLSPENLKSVFTEYYMGNYHPLAMLSLSIDFKIGGLDHKKEIKAWIYHFTNILLHLFNTLLVFWLVYMLFARFETAVIASLLFGIATLHVESVAWISERKDVLYALFFIASLIAYVYYVKYRKLKYYIISFVLFILSLFSKGQAVSLAVSIIAIDYLFDRKLLDKKLILEKIPYFILAFVFGIIAIKAQQAGNALHDADSYEFYKRIGFAGYAFTQYLIKLLIPVGLSAIYPYPDIINKAIPNYYWLFMIPSLLVVYAFFYFLKRSKTVAFFIAFFIINIVLLLQLIPVGSAIWADRYSYIPSIAYYALIAWLIHQLVINFESKRMFIYGITGIYILSLAIASFERCKVWESSAILWDDTVEKSPKAVVAWNNRGSIKDKDEDHTGAIEDFTRAIVLKPDYTHAFYNRAVAKRNLAKIRKDSTLLKSAIQDFEKAIKFDPKFVEAIHNKGLAIETLSDYMQLPDQKNILLLKALADYDETLELNPEYVSALVSRGVVKGKLNHLDEAIEIFNKAISMKPENEQAYVNRGLAKDLKGDFNGAIADYNMAVQLKPDFDNALLNRGIVYRKLQNYQASINDFSEAIRINPKLEAAWYFRGLDLIMTDHKEAGCKDLQMAEQLGYPYAKQQIQIYCNK